MKRSCALFALIAVGCSPASKPAVTDDHSGVAESPQELAQQADIPLYPGATFPEGKSNVRKSGNETRYEIVMSSGDAEPKVTAFYKEKLKLSPIPNTKTLMGMTPSGGMAKVDIHREGTATLINAVSIREQKSSG